jgi:hypothetical protein
MAPSLGPDLSSWKVSISVQTPVGPWAFSLGLVALDRAEAEVIATDYVGRMCAYGSISAIKRVTRIGLAHGSGPGVFTAIAGRGDRVPA